MAPAPPWRIARQAVVLAASLSCAPFVVESVPVDSLVQKVTIGIKHTSQFRKRREMLEILLRSIRRLHGHQLRIIVADDGGASDEAVLRTWNAELLKLPTSSGLGHGRNALVRATRTRFFALLDDDVLFHQHTGLSDLVDALERDSGAVLAAGCYMDVRFNRKDCFTLQFEADEGGSVVRAHPAQLDAGGCSRVHATHNFFVAHTSTLARFGWDPRQRVMEHETFFYQLFLNQLNVLACPQ
eukprot:3335740-Prymnesium_polylepis.1